MKLIQAQQYNIGDKKHSEPLTAVPNAFGPGYIDEQYIFQMLQQFEQNEGEQAVLLKDYIMKQQNELNLQGTDEKRKHMVSFLGQFFEVESPDEGSQSARQRFQWQIDQINTK